MKNLVRFAHNWNNGTMEYWDHWCSIWLKNNTVHGINKPWIEKTSTEDLEYLNYLNIALSSCGEFHSCKIRNPPS